ncbi:TetR family transcriptional regulator [Rathayibacter sp. PhB151]|uniref:TetR/AcrR family transcriptional regulator n=1 Tax=Rathayibacter sp. PhB151 TaxID=2485189 RepID=UPI001062B745|nr:TetR family transcriptional regulator [Rathayibacter sp. PhB151]TDX74957.1 TetR family transcriptional regulator [Rathayibacter sp. PhB151]
MAKRGESRAKLLQTALRLFAERGVNGTSLQTIADELGVTKAAVYHQFATKDEIVLAVVQPALERMADLVQEADAGDDPFETTLVGLVGLAVEHREFAAAIQRDPAVIQLLRQDPDFVAATTDIDRHLIGTDPTPEARIALAVAGGGLMIAGMDPSLRATEPEVLTRVLLKSARTVLAPYKTETAAK